MIICYVICYLLFVFGIVNMSCHFSGSDEGAVHAPKYISFLNQLSNEKLVPHITPLKSNKDWWKTLQFTEFPILKYPNFERFNHDLLQVCH